MSTAVAKQSQADQVESALIMGDLAKLGPAERLAYYHRVCESLGLNPWTRPFDYITLNSRLTLYARRDATDQLRASRKVSVAITSRERLEDVYVVTARATMPDGRQDESIGAVSLKGLSGNDLANALMKSETKAKRRVTLSIVGLGWLDETETETVPGARAAHVDVATGEIQEPQDDPSPQDAQTQVGTPSSQPVAALTEVQKRNLAGFRTSLNGALTKIAGDLAYQGKLEDLRHECLHRLAGVESTDAVPQSDYGKVIAGLRGAVSDLMDETRAADEAQAEPKEEVPA